MIKIIWEAPEDLIKQIISDIKTGKEDTAIFSIKWLINEAFEGGLAYQKKNSIERALTICKQWKMTEEELDALLE